ncbi:MAG TPA: hypothetical protein VGI99_11320 [Gemmataceae bacterium]
MPYNTFTLDRVRADFGITIQTRQSLFAHIPPVEPDPVLATYIERYRGLAVAIGTEKAKSELIIAPLLGDVWRRGGDRLALLSGIAFNVDPASDLTGICDFILGYAPQLDYVTNPVMVITEAKNDNVMGGLGQCAAAMVASQRFNRGRNPEITTVYGCVSTGIDWKFLRLCGTTLEIDLDDYVIHNPGRILGIVMSFVSLPAVKTPAAA